MHLHFEDRWKLGPSSLTEAMASNLEAMVSNLLISDGLQPNSGGLQPTNGFNNDGVRFDIFFCFEVYLCSRRVSSETCFLLGLFGLTVAAFMELLTQAQARSPSMSTVVLNRF